MLSAIYGLESPANILRCVVPLLIQGTRPLEHAHMQTRKRRKPGRSAPCRVKGIHRLGTPDLCQSYGASV